MKPLNDRERALLAMLAMKPRTANNLTNGPQSIAPHIVELYLDRLCTADLVFVTGKVFDITDAGRALLNAVEPNPVPSRYYGNASTPPGSYKGPRWNVREGGLKFMDVPSLGTGA